MQAAVKLHQDGKMAEAEHAYRALKAAEPMNFLATYNLGIVIIQQGRMAEGEPFLAEAIRLNPALTQAQIVHADVLSKLNRREEAVAVFGRILAKDPNHAAALIDRSNTLMRMNRMAEAMADIDRVLAQDPKNVIALYNRASILAGQNRPEEALAALDTICAVKPNFAEAHFFKGNLLRGLKRIDAAIKAFEAAVAANPQHHDALNNLGDAQSELGRYTEALESFDRAFALAPGSVEIVVNRGRMLGKLGRGAEQLAAYDQAIALKPDFVPALLSKGIALLGLRRHDEAIAVLDRALALAANGGADAATRAQLFEARGNVLAMLGRRDEAVASYESVIAVAPTIGAWNNYGHVLRRLSRYEEAARAYEQVIALKPDFPMGAGYLLASRLYCCIWTDVLSTIAAMESDILAGKPVTNPFGLVQFSHSPEAQRRAAEIFIAAKKRPARAWQPGARETGRIRVAYLSADLQNHATAFLMAGMFEAHDRAKFETIAISFARGENDFYRKRLQKAFDRFIDASSMTDDEVVDLARRLEVDIAVDLKGFTNEARPEIFMDRIAPLQVSFVGYPGTWGAACMDYLVADPVIIPPGAERYYSESIVRLPDSYQPNDRARQISPDVPSRADVGLPAEGFVFCSFNSNYKILPPIFDIWMRLLAKVPGSVLWLLAGTDAAVTNLRREAAARGVDPDRLAFASVASPPDHLARQVYADLFLDTLPCSAHTTASDALWAGLPVLTCLGQTFAGRVAASLLTAAGLPELVTNSLAEYESLALTLATAPEKLKGLRQKLADNRLTCALFDTQKFCRHLEAAYTAMWDRQTRGLPPAHIDVARL